jgi:hypothetical protein
MESEVSVCILLYGDHPDLAHRCLESIWSGLEGGVGYIKDFRLGLNEVSAGTRAIIAWFCNGVLDHFSIPIIVYDCPENAFKYPLMRRMILDEETPVAKSVMWFDDDSYINKHKDTEWWGTVKKAASGCDMMGKIYRQAMLPKQWDWITKQSWYNPKLGLPPQSKIRRFGKRPTFRFCTGGWWVADSKIFLDNDWPTKELKLIGGDSMLGELCRHRQYSLANFEDGIRINANAWGEHSSAPGRGESPLVKDRVAVMLGNWIAPPEIHNFVCNKRNSEQWLS